MLPDHKMEVGRMGLKGKLSESQLDRAFADEIARSTEFARWVLMQTKFRDFAEELVLLNKEQEQARSTPKPENWWRYWWCGLDDKKQSETDIFLVFQHRHAGTRIALHIEDKPPYGKFGPDQYLNYKRRAEFMANKLRFMNYSEFTTILVAPSSFIENNRDKVLNFECVISYEALSNFIPLFAQSLQQAPVASLAT